MTKGRIKWFNNAKGYGFICEEGKNEDVFVHYTAIQGEGYKSLKNGEEVEFTTCEGEKGLHAQDVVKIV
ncbi:Cold shock protein of CSP family [hydrothermal vent metagenome]